jgi:hypothetical protein
MREAQWSLFLSGGRCYQGVGKGKFSGPRDHSTEIAWNIPYEKKLG